MAAPLANADLVSIALDRVEGNRFERFVNALYPAIAGVEYIPLGGMHDGGADGFFGLSEVHGSASDFLQVSVQEDHRAKIRDTIKRLIAFGRAPQNLTYVTSRVIPYIDREEAFLGKELGVAIRIRDRTYIAAHVNTSNVTVAAFEDHLRPLLGFLNTPGNVPLIEPSKKVESPAVYVFLRQEVERRLGKSSLLETVADGLILWALEGTDPDKGIFMSRPEILGKIEHTVPPARHFIRGVFNHRLELLASKNNPSGREVRWHKKQDRFCLPFETRKIVEDENVADEAVRVKVVEVLINRAATVSGGSLSAEEAERLAHVALRALQSALETEGLEFTAFLHGSDDDRDEFSLADAVDAALQQANIPGALQVEWKSIVVRMLRYTIYESTPEERLYLGKLCRTYLLLFSLNAEPRIVEYFQNMAADFYLYVGADILIHVLSERHLRPDDQMTTHLLEMLSRAGATLVLAEPVIGEVTYHLETTDWEYRNYFAGIEPHMTIDLARHSSKILIRAFFYALLQPAEPRLRPRGWKSYIEQFCSYDDLHRPAGREELKGYFLNKFKMRYESAAELEKLCDPDQLTALTAKLLPTKKNEVLAYNDALMILATYGRRDALGEQSRTTSFGYRTWWLTHEARVRQHTHDLYRAKGSHYIMRPEFLLNFIALSPTTVEVRRAYENIFPTLLGVKLSGRMKEAAFHDLLKQVNEAAQHEEPRLRVLIATMSDKLKGDFYKQYEKDVRDGVAELVSPFNS